MIITSTSIIPRNMNHRRPVLLAMKIPAGASIAIQYPCDGEWVTGETLNADAVRTLESYKCEVQLVINGAAKAQIHGLER